MPFENLRHILSVGRDVGAMLDEFILDKSFDVRLATAKLRHPVNYVVDQMKTVKLVAHAHVERCGGAAFFLIAAHVQIVVIAAPIRQPVD